MNKTEIDWCDCSWNPVTGCKHNCPYCYARGIARRFTGTTVGVRPPKEYAFSYENHDLAEPLFRVGKNDELVQAAYPFGFEPTFHRYRLDEPARKTRPRTIFVGSMCDLFGNWVPDEWIDEVFAACAKAPQHSYLFLTKNPNRYMKLIKNGKLPPEHWYGETRTEGELLGLPEPYKHFVSVEPITGAAYFSPLTRIGGVIVGAETGNRRDKVVPEREWIADIMDRCKSYHVPLFMKQNLAPYWDERLIQELPWEVKSKSGNERSGTKHE